MRTTAWAAAVAARGRALGRAVCGVRSSAAVERVCAAPGALHPRMEVSDAQHMSRRAFVCKSVALGAAVVAFGAHSMALAEPQPAATASELKVEDIKVGDGPEALAGMEVKVNYTGWLNSFGGKQFDSSVGRRPLKFRLGTGMVISGWDTGVQGMRVGGTRRLTIPPQLAYGSRSVGNGLIPANSTLYFEVTLLGVSK